MGREPVAVIGLALALPGADDLRSLHENLWHGRINIGPPGPLRVQATADGHPDGGYLDRVDLFDHAFFGISLGEAEAMDPGQRLGLPLVHRAIENAGYAPAALRGSNTAVIVSASSRDCPPPDDPHAILGTMPAAAAARIAYVFDLTGPALVVDTACSGSLAALALAVDKLRDGRADLAIAGGIGVHQAEPGDALRGVESPDGVCRPFDATANGTVGGEGGGFVVLKRLSDALTDRDVIHAVLRGVAVNQNGSRATSMSAPSRRAQADVIRAAWRDSGIEPATIGFVECHGSGTELGDLVEVDGLLRTFTGVAPLEIGTVKANIGHLDHASGIAGLFKAIAGLRYGALYPTPRFETPNALLADTDTVRVSTRARPWPGPRRAGLSSYGITGTNVHAVVEQPPEPAAPPREGPVHLVTVSAVSRAALERRIQQLTDFLRKTEHGLPEVAHALNRGRDDHPYRWAGTARDKAGLLAALSTARLPDRAVARDVPVVMLFPGDGQVEDAAWAGLRTDFPALPAAAGEAPGGRLFARQHALYRLLRSLGLTESGLAGSGVGNLVVRVARGRLPAAEAMREAAGSPLTDAVDAAGLERAVRGFTRDNAVLLAMAPGTLTREISRLAPELPMVDPPAEGVLAALGRLYELGAAIDWERHYADMRIPRVEVPTYPFEPVSCRTRPPRTPPLLPPGDDVEEHVAAIWAEVLKSGPLGPAADYFQLGGTSIAGITVLRELERRFGVHLGFADLYERRTVRELAAVVRDRRTTAPGDAGWAIARVPRGGRLPLSYNQEQLWYLDRLNPGGSLYSIPGALRYHGPLDPAAFEGALRDLVDRHEVLRVRVPDDDGVPYALADTMPRLKVIDLRPLPAEERERQAAALMREEAGTPFDLGRGPLFRATLVELAGDDHLLLYTWHHIVFDGWSPSVFFADLAELYDARLHRRAPDLVPLPAQYADFAAWQRSRLTGERLVRGLTYWRARLADAPFHELPLDRPRGQVESHAGDLVEFTLDARLTEQLRTFSRREGVTTFVTMLAVLDVALYLWTGQEDVVVGAATSGRVNPATHDMIGYFNNVLPFRTRVRGDLGLRDLVRRCADTVAGALDHEEVPLSRIVAELAPRRDPARHPLFSVGYSYQNAPAHPAALPGLGPPSNGQSATGIAPGTSKVDLTFGVSDEEPDAMTGYLEYAVDLFDRGTARRLADLFQQVATAAVAEGDRRVDELVPGWHRPGPGNGERSAREDDRSVCAAVEAHAAERPDHPAVVTGAGGRSYREVDERADRLARRLVAAGVGAGSIVPVIARRGAGLVIGWLAVLKAGAAFAPLDPAAPAARLESILTELDAPVLLTDGHAAPWSAPGKRLTIEEPDAGCADAAPPGAPAAPEALAYVAFTSGSTGRPHGCAVEHRGLLNLLRWYGETTGLSPADRVAQLISPGFDAAIMEILAALYHGATIHVGDPLQTPAAVSRWMDERRITVAGIPAPMAELVLAEPSVPAETSLRVLVTGGDRLRVRPSRGVPFRVLNMYGPTECAVTATCEEVAATGDALPGIGTPITGTTAYILNQAGHPVRGTEAGELCLGGAGVGRGYHGRPALTASRFVPDPFAARPGARMYRTGDLARPRGDGTIEFLGRADDQVQIRGHRVEPAELERVLLAHPQVSQAAVITEDGPGGPRLVAHVAGDRTPTEPELLAWAARDLPDHLLPTRVAGHERLPTTANGKLDRTTLKRTTLRGTETPMSTVRTGATNGKARAGESGEAERLLGKIMAELLGREHMPSDVGFFTLGGDSVLSVAVAARAARAGLEITPQDVLLHQTPRALATAAMGNAVPESYPDEKIPLTPLIHGMLDSTGGDVADFVSAEVLEIAPGVRAGALRTALEHLVELHEPLRYRLRRNSLGWWMECAASETAHLFDTRVLPPSEGAEPAVLEADKDELIAGLDVGRGPLVRARFYDRGPSRAGILVLAIHHFAFDHVSAVPLLEDLNAALADIAATGRPQPAQRPPAWRDWAKHLVAMAQSDELAGELAYWTAVLAAGESHVAPTQGLAAAQGERPEPGVVTRVISQVAPVLRVSGPAGRAAALCAVACAWARWRDGEDAYLMTVGHGTPNVFRPVDRSRSLGWFTNGYPLLLPVGGGTDVRGAMGAVTDTLDSVPNDGVGYGILRHLSPRSPAVAGLRALPEPQVLVEHTASGGDTIDLGGGPASIRATPLMVRHRSLLEHVPIAVSSAVRGDSLYVHVAHHGGLAGEDMESLAGHLSDTFTELGRGR
ncbi:non-ribosomal peptide synthetase [Nonomuraea guangzhouensis]|uniref:Non-ribosomal peptide synthetase n=1 Tax=Nonomuraea guangzhouensis TaxID=1291555 RepID=A0ABW4FZI6_9ACTN|nr:non-ribosomal peptide synthetase [Nonomuraea guangzhouensis]